MFDLLTWSNSQEASRSSFTRVYRSGPPLCLGPGPSINTIHLLWSLSPRHVPLPSSDVDVHCSLCFFRPWCPLKTKRAQTKTGVQLRPARHAASSAKLRCACRQAPPLPVRCCKRNTQLAKIQTSGHAAAEDALPSWRLRPRKRRHVRKAQKPELTYLYHSKRVQESRIMCKQGNGSCCLCHGYEIRNILDSNWDRKPSLDLLAKRCCNAAWPEELELKPALSFTLLLGATLMTHCLVCETAALCLPRPTSSRLSTSCSQPCPGHRRQICQAKAAYTIKF